MNFKTLLLGSAAVIVSAAGSAQAADLSVAEPVDYVRVCDAFGEGYFYIPGSETCISLSGKLEVGIEFGDSFDGAATEYNTYTGTDVVVDARSMTDWGPLVGYIAMTAKYSASDNEHFEIDEAFIALGPMTAGFTDSIFDVQNGGYTDGGLDLSNDDVNQLALAWAFNGFGLAIAVEDPRERYGSSATSTPHLAAALTSEFSGWEAGLSFLYAPNEADDTVAVQGVVKTEIGMWEFELAGIWIDGKGIETWNDEETAGWAVAASSQQNWQSNFYTAETFVWSDMDLGDQWGAEFTIGYSPVDSVWFVANAATVDEAESWDFLVYIEKKFGPNG